MVKTGLTRTNSPHFQHSRCKFCNAWIPNGFARLNHQKICAMLARGGEGVKTLLDTGLEPPENVEDETNEGPPYCDDNEGVGSAFSSTSGYCRDTGPFPRAALVSTRMCHGGRCHPWKRRCAVLYSLQITEQAFRWRQCKGL